MTAALLACSSYMTDTREMPSVHRGYPIGEALTMPFLFDAPPVPEQPSPVPQRLPKRLRRRGARHLADAWRDAWLTRVATATATLGMAATTLAGAL